jgi:hypothetical protein
MKLFCRTVVFNGLLIALSFLTVSVHGQCKGFTKKRCIPELAPYIHNGQLTSTLLNPGDFADVDLTFNAGKEYKIVVCSHNQIGKVQFKVLDASRKVLYASDKEEVNPSWIFRVENTQKLIVQLRVPKMEANNQDMVPNGCVALLVGFKQ